MSEHARFRETDFQRAERLQAQLNLANLDLKRCKELTTEQVRRDHAAGFEVALKTVMAGLDGVEQVSPWYQKKFVRRLGLLVRETRNPFNKEQ